MEDLFDQGQVVAPTRRWGVPMELVLDTAAVSFHPAADAATRMRVNVDAGALSEVRMQRLVLHLVSVDGVVPPTARRDAAGAVTVPCARPTGIARDWLAWTVAPGLRVVCDDLAVAVEVEPGRTVLDLSGREAWSFAQALTAASVWWTKVQAVKLASRANLRLEVLAGTVEGQEGVPFVPTRLMFEPEMSVPVRPRGEIADPHLFIIRDGRVSAYEGRGPISQLELLLTGLGPDGRGSLELGADGAESLLELMANSSVVPSDAHVDSTAGVHVPLVEPTGVDGESGWWQITEQLWLVQRGLDGVEFARPAGRKEWAEVMLTAAEGWQLMRALASVRREGRYGSSLLAAER